jgi:hypothetical protein
MSHVTIEELTAQANGAPVSAASQAHIAACDSCGAEAGRWNAVAGGVRLLTTDPPPFLMDVAKLPRRPRRRVALASAAAVVVLLTIVYGVSLAFRSPGDQPSTSDNAELAAASLVSTDCSNLKVVAGTLESVNGTNLVLRTPNGASVTVSTSDFTEITRLADGALRDITNGAHVVVRGEGTDPVAAETVGIMPSSANPPPIRLPALGGHAFGTVADVHSGGFTVVRSDGTRVRVTTSSSTAVTKQVSARIGDLEKGKFTVAVGNSAGEGTLNATSVQQNGLRDGGTIRVPRELPRPPKGLPSDFPGVRPSGPRALPRDLFKGLGCDPRTIGTAAMFAGD